MLKNKIIFTIEKLFILSPIIWLFLAIFNVPDSKHALSRMLVIVTLYCAIRFNNWQEKFKNKSFKWFFYSSFTMALYFALLHLLFDYDIGFSRTVLPILLYLVFVPKYFLDKTSFFLIIVLATIVTGISALHEYFYLGYRAGTTAINAIPFATYAAIIFFTAIFMGKEQLPQIKKYKTIWIGLFFIGLTLSLCAIIFSMTRGVWLATLIASLFLLFMNIKRLLKHKVKSVVLLAGLITVLFVTHEQFESRLKSTINEITQISQGNRNTSIAIRLQVYESGINHFLTSPLVGLTYDEDRLLSDKDLVEDRITSVGHFFLKRQLYHNQFIYLLVYTGILGLTLFLCYIGVVLFLFRNETGVARNVAAVSVLILLIAGMTDMPFHHTHITYLFTMLMGLLVIIYSPELE